VNPATQLPVNLGLYPSGESQISKYKFSGEINENTLEEWVKSFIARNFLLIS